MAIVGVGIECVGKKALDPRADRMLGRRPSAAGRGAVIEPLSTGPLERSRQLQAGVRKWADARRAAGTAVSQTQITERARPEYIMAHSLSHALTSEVAIDCGYPASALKERIYVLPRLPREAIRCGALIYTASAGN